MEANQDISPDPCAFKDIYRRTGELLGQSESSRVETFVNIDTGKQFAVKTIEKAAEIYSRSEVINEIQVNFLCEGHSNIVQLLEYFEEADKFYLVFEKMHGGSLLQHIENGKHLTEENASSIIKSLTQSLVFLHDQGIAHRDIKPANVLCVNQGSPFPVKLCDFDLCSELGNSRRYSRHFTAVGTSDFMAPEVVDTLVIDRSVCNYEELFYDQRCDLWSLGVLMYILLCGYPPFTGHCGEECGWDLGEACQNCDVLLFSSIKEGSFKFPENEWSNVSMEAKHLIESLLEKDVDSRLDAEDVLSHPWIVNQGCDQQYGRHNALDNSPHKVFNLRLHQNG